MIRRSASCQRELCVVCLALLPVHEVARMCTVKNGLFHNKMFIQTS